MPVEGPMRAAVALSALFFGCLAATGLGAQTVTNCQQYTDTALAQYFAMRQSDCNLAGPEWHDNYNNHMNWCLGVNDVTRWQRETKKRQQALNRCGSTPLAAHCRDYAQRAVADHEKSEYYDCDFEGVRWHGNYGLHFNWCLNVSIDKSLQEQSARLSQLVTAKCVLQYFPDKGPSDVPEPKPESPLGKTGQGLTKQPFDPAAPVGEASPTFSGAETFDPARPHGDAGAQAVQGLSRQFAAPTVGAYGIDVCLNWGTSCGQPAADEFCRRQGYARATEQGVLEDAPPTLVLGDNAVCDQPFCDRFAYITCGR
jgi:hypothetical protein